MSFSPDGQCAVFRSNTGEGARPVELLLLPLQGERKPIHLGPTSFSAAHPAISPNSKWIAYESNATGRFEAYVSAIDGGGGVLRVSSGGGTEPRWAADGRLVYRDNASFRAATLSDIGGALTITRRDSLFADVYRRNEDRHNYDISHDGRFVVARDASEQGGIVVVVNWLAEVRSKLLRR